MCRCIMEIKRDFYLNKLIEKKWNKRIKIITGLRRVGKSYLLFNLFKNHLLKEKVLEDQIITFAFDNAEDLRLLERHLPEQKTLLGRQGNTGLSVNHLKFIEFILEKTKDDTKKYYILLDEIQLLEYFVFVLNGLLRHENFDVYVTGSNSKLLSKDIATEFRGRGDAIHLYPLSFKEYFDCFNTDFDSAFFEYSYFGGMPIILNEKTHADKQKLLKSLFTEIYIKDITEYNSLKNTDAFSQLLEILASQIGSFTNSSKLANTFKSKIKINYNNETIKSHIEYIKNSFLLTEAKRYDLKGKKYIGAGSKYYFADPGLRNALINFRQVESTHIFENIVYNQLILNGFSVDVGMVEISEKTESEIKRKTLEIDFVCNKLNERIYIQVAYSLADLDKLNQEKKSLLQVKDNFRKVIVVQQNIHKFFSEEGIEIVSLKDFLLNGI